MCDVDVDTLSHMVFSVVRPGAPSSMVFSYEWNPWNPWNSPSSFRTHPNTGRWGVAKRSQTDRETERGPVGLFGASGS